MKQTLEILILRVFVPSKFFLGVAMLVDASLTLLINLPISNHSCGCCMLYLSAAQCCIAGFDYTSVGNSTSKKDAQANAAKDMVQYLVRIGQINAIEVPTDTQVTKHEALPSRLMY